MYVLLLRPISVGRYAAALGGLQFQNGSFFLDPLNILHNEEHRRKRLFRERSVNRNTK